MAWSPTPPLTLDLTWQGGMRFTGTSGAASIALDGASKSAPTPVQALAFSLAACMSIDLVQILTKGRHGLKALRAHLEGKRRDVEPRHFTAIRLHFALIGCAALAWTERLRTLARLLPTLLIFFTILGGIYGGVFTPTEASAIGAVALVVVALLTLFPRIALWLPSLM